MDDAMGEALVETRTPIDPEGGAGGGENRFHIAARSGVTHVLDSSKARWHASDGGVGERVLFAAIPWLRKVR